MIRRTAFKAFLAGRGGNRMGKGEMVLIRSITGNTAKALTIGLSVIACIEPEKSIANVKYLLNLRI